MKLVKGKRYRVTFEGTAQSVKSVLTDGMLYHFLADTSFDDINENIYTVEQLPDPLPEPPKLGTVLQCKWRNKENSSHWYGTMAAPTIFLKYYAPERYGDTPRLWTFTSSSPTHTDWKQFLERDDYEIVQMYEPILTV